ncbi:MAG: acetyl-CoA synthetase [Thermofilum sp. ex4484_79]|nr:MAG: acetyl-CoA synthetase [Thermofilum sp. ex4484_79]
MNSIVPIFEKVLNEGRANLSLYEALNVVKAFGLPVAKFVLVKDIDDIEKVRGVLSPPFVAKISSPDVIHKTDVGGIFLNIQTEEELKYTVENILENVKRRMSNAKIDGVIVQEMIKRGYEVIIGGLRDQQFGPVVAFGLGGVFVEVLKDVAFDIAPIEPEEALSLIKSIKGYRILLGYRGKPPANLESLANMLSKASQFLWEYRRYIKEMDLNPVIVTSKNSYVVDSRIILSAIN